MGRGPNPTNYLGARIARHYAGWSDTVFLGRVTGETRPTGQNLAVNCIFEVYFPAQLGRPAEYDDFYFEEVVEGMELYAAKKKNKTLPHVEF